MFGSEDGEKFKDKYGFEYQGFLDYVVGRASRIFDEFENKMKEGFKSLWEKFKGTTVGGWIAEKGGAFARDVGGRVKSKFRWAKNRVGRTYYNAVNAINQMRRGRVFNADDLVDELNPGDKVRITGTLKTFREERSGKFKNYI